MAQIVKTDPFKAAFCQQLWKSHCDVARLDPSTKFIYIYKVQIICAIAFSAHLAVFILRCAQFDKKPLKWFYDRQRSSAGLSLSAFLFYYRLLAADVCFSNGVLNRESLFLKIDCVPFQAYYLTAPEPVESA